MNSRSKKALKTKKGKEKNSNWQSDLYEWLQLLTFVLVFVTIFFTFFGMVFGVSGSSMYPTLHNGDAIFVQRIGYTPQQGDIVVIKTDNFPPPPDQPEAIVKRVIATAGQEVEIDYTSNTVYVDGVALDEDYLNFENEMLANPEEFGNDYMVKRPGMTDFDHDGDPDKDNFIVPEGCIFVMGDNRNGSTDSRYAQLGENGMIDTRYVVGRALFVFFPFARAQTLFLS